MLSAPQIVKLASDREADGERVERVLRGPRQPGAAGDRGDHGRVFEGDADLPPVTTRTGSPSVWTSTVWMSRFVRRSGYFFDSSASFGRMTR